jgi:DNA-binding response OmpR family regulator
MEVAVTFSRRFGAAFPPETAMTTFSEALLEPEAEAIPASPRPNILIVDDDETMADVLSIRLRHQGFEAISATAGATGLSLARSEHPSVVLLDLVLPDGDGLDYCCELTGSPETWSIPVIVISGLDRPSLLRDCRNAGARFFLRKPYDPNVLLTLIQHVIDEAAGW